MLKIFTYFLTSIVMYAPPIHAASSGSPLDEALHAFDHSSLAVSGDALLHEFREKGFVVIKGVPGFYEKYRRFLQCAQAFVALSDEFKAKSASGRPGDFGWLGWSRGIETFHGRTDTFKGSYYALVPDTSDNVWPEDVVGFKEAYEDLGATILEVGRTILPLIGFSEPVTGVGRMLHYQSPPSDATDDNPFWCGKHCDNGLFTGLCPGVYLKDGKIVQGAAESGLFIEGEKIEPPLDNMIFQISEALEIITDGRVRASEHWVNKARDGSERYSFPLFFSPDFNRTIWTDHAKTREKYSDRLTHPMTFTEWDDVSEKKYHPKCDESIH